LKKGWRNILRKRKLCYINWRKNMRWWKLNSYCRLILVKNHWIKNRWKRYKLNSNKGKNNLKKKSKKENKIYSYKSIVSGHLLLK
jgi:hypothetical protein